MCLGKVLFANVPFLDAVAATWCAKLTAANVRALCGECVPVIEVRGRHDKN